MPLLPMAVYGLEVPCGDVPIPAVPDFPASFQITMAAIDPSAMPEGETGLPPRATLKILRAPMGDDDSEDDYDGDEMDRMFAGEDSDEDSDDDEEAAGPSDPSKSKKARKAAAMEAIKKLLEQDEMEVDAKPSKKGKGKAPVEESEDEEDDEDLEDDDEDEEIEEFVLCTLDPVSHFQQPLNITIGENERVYFQVSGTHSIFLTGNYVEPAHDHEHGEEGESDEEYSEDEYDSEDDLDDMEDPRITEITEEDEEAPKLVEAKKGKNKRAADESLDNLITESKAEPTEKLSKKQAKKAKTAAAAEEEAPSSAKSDKKVQFAKNLEQGPTPTKAAPVAEKPKAAAGPRVVNGVTIDDKKAGTGPAAKNGDRVGMRYIGKLQKNNKVFDSNKKGKPFTFKLGSGEVIKGWDIGVAGMAVGAERRITIPAHHAYGARGAPPDIPGGATLVFDVKVVEINKGK
ncbi:hypothetical protein Q7P35_007682 [Cladosporium inversicolor]